MCFSSYHPSVCPHVLDLVPYALVGEEFVEIAGLPVAQLSNHEEHHAGREELGPSRPCCHARSLSGLGGLRYCHSALSSSPP